jgi:holo-[acyl-carrier protein] synthase
VIVGSGIDVIEIARIERALTRRGARFERRVFTEQEIAACRRFARPAPHFAMRFAAKEAMMKALGTGWARGVRWLDIEWVPEGREFDRPALRLHRRVAERVERGAAVPHLSVTRTRSHAVAVVLLETSTG